MNVVNFKKLCRVCLRESDFVTPMFGTVFKSDIPDKLAYCTGLKITSGDGKPSLICQSCIDNLHISYAFKQTCLKSDRHFLRHFFGIKHELKVKVERMNDDRKPKTIKFEVPIKKEEEDIPVIKIDDSDNENDIRDYNNDDMNYDDNQNENEFESKFVINDISAAEPLKNAITGDDDDFYWHDDEQLINVLESEQVTCSKKKPKRQETKPRKKYKQKIGKDGKPKLSKAQLQRERAKKRPPRILPDDDGLFKRNKHVPKVNLSRYCQCCELMFPSHAERDKHAEDVHGGITSKVICEVCGKTYDRNYIENHLRAHFPPQYSCKQPGCAFKTTRANHMVKHNQQVHAGAERPTFPCEKCARVFMMRSSLRDHMERQHGGERRRNFACSYCCKAFFTKQKLDIHERIHTNEKPYICEHCPLSFIRRETWKSHLLNSHGVVPPPVKGGPRIHRVVEIDKLKDAGKLVALEKTNDSVNITNDSANRTNDSVNKTNYNFYKTNDSGSRTNDNSDKTNDNYLYKTNDNLNITNDNSGFTIQNLMQERGVQITIEDTDVPYYS